METIGTANYRYYDDNGDDDDYYYCSCSCSSKPHAYSDWYCY